MFIRIKKFNCIKNNFMDSKYIRITVYKNTSILFLNKFQISDPNFKIVTENSQNIMDSEIEFNERVPIIRSVTVYKKYPKLDYHIYSESINDSFDSFDSYNFECTIDAFNHIN